MLKVSIIVPNYNHAPYLKQRIESILNQTYQDFELIILDDCSTDNSKEIIEQYRNHPKLSQIVYNAENSGSTFKQWDKGIKLAKGEYIWIAESDDWADEHFLETVVVEFEKRSNVGLIYTASKLIDNTGKITYENLQNESEQEYRGDDFIKNKLFLNCTIWNASMMMFRRSIYPHPDKQVLYKQKRYCGDWFFYVLLAEQMDVLEIKKTLNYFRVHSQNVSGNAEKSGLTFIEGLDVYVYIKKRFNFVERIKVSIEWTKKYNRYRFRYNYSRVTRKTIRQNFLKKSFSLFVCNMPISLYYYLKNAIK